MYPGVMHDNLDGCGLRNRLQHLGTCAPVCYIETDRLGTTALINDGLCQIRGTACIAMAVHQDMKTVFGKP